MKPDTQTSIKLPDDWYDYIIKEGVKVELPGIYEWDIEGCGVYIGKYTNINRPKKAYTRNVQNILNGKAYRLSKPNDFRRIHRELAKAYREGRRITLTILENVAPLHLNARERELIKERRSTLNDL